MEDWVRYRDSGKGGWETIRFPVGELASLLGRFTTCGVSPSPFSHGSLTVSLPPCAYFDERTLRCEKISSTFTA